MPYQPIALYGLEVPPGDFLVPVTQASRVTVSTPTEQQSVATLHAAMRQ